MYPCSFKIRASSCLRREDGIVTSWCWALAALRRRVRKSATGSVMDMICSRLPAALGHAGDIAVVRELAQADPAQAELAIHRAGTAATATPGVAPRFVLRCPLLA